MHDIKITMLDNDDTYEMILGVDSDISRSDIDKMFRVAAVSFYRTLQGLQKGVT